MKSVIRDGKIAASEVNRITAVIEKEAVRLAESAGYAGAMDDGGAGRLREQLEFWQAGLAGDVPKEWDEYLKPLDPEYAEYLRLHKKFKK
jgi:hypothetical protein